MTMTDFSTAIIDSMLSWLKGLANWVLKLFNLAGSGGESPLVWLSRNWLKLLILLMIVGVAVDVLIWLVRWRPHWVWFRRERVIVDDERFFNATDIQDRLDDEEDPLEKNWSERDYVVASTVVRRRKPSPEALEAEARRKQGSTRRDRRTHVRREDHRPSGMTQAPDPFSTRRQKEGEGDLFGVNGSHPGVTDLYEDEVFNVNNLPAPEESPATTEA